MTTEIKPAAPPSRGTNGKERASTEPDLGQCWCLPAAVRFVHGHDGGTLLDITRDRFHRLNPSGALILSRLVAGLTVEQIAIEVTSVIEEPTEGVRNDLLSFITDLEERRLIAKCEFGVKR